MTAFAHSSGEAVVTGLESCLSDPPPVLRNRRFGLLMNQASVDRELNYACDALARRLPGQLVSLFSPQHGLWGEQQANMDESEDSRYPPLDLPVHSLYGDTRVPSEAMFDNIDVLIVDLQDVGVRVYTYVWTVMNCLSVAATTGTSVLILDRPNPIGGEVVEGALLNLDYQSFVGQAAIPMRHGLTLAELAQLINALSGIGAELSVVPMRGWRRAMYFADTQLPWVPPSPNLPTAASALFYPGMVLLEGTNLSEGRGTTRPFELLGAPFVDPWRLVDRLNPLRLLGMAMRPVRFRPTFDKWQNQSCGGLAFHPQRHEMIRSFDAAVTLMSAIRRLWPSDFQWRPPPYEYETEKMPIDIISGGSAVRQVVDGTQDNLAREVDLDEGQVTRWWKEVEPFLLYD